MISFFKIVYFDVQFSNLLLYIFIINLFLLKYIFGLLLILNKLKQLFVEIMGKIKIYVYYYLVVIRINKRCLEWMF